jgi:hypothetical protein
MIGNGFLFRRKLRRFEIDKKAKAQEKTCFLMKNRGFCIWFLAKKR